MYHWGNLTDSAPPGGRVCRTRIHFLGICIVFNENRYRLCCKCSNRVYLSKNNHSGPLQALRTNYGHQIPVMLLLRCRNLAQSPIWFWGIKQLVFVCLHYACMGWYFLPQAVEWISSVKCGATGEYSHNE